MLRPLPWATCTNLGKVYDGVVVAMSICDLELRPGELALQTCVSAGRCLSATALAQQVPFI